MLLLPPLSFPSITPVNLGHWQLHLSLLPGGHEWTLRQGSCSLMMPCSPLSFCLSALDRVTLRLSLFVVASWPQASPGANGFLIHSQQRTGASFWIVHEWENTFLLQMLLLKYPLSVLLSHFESQSYCIPTIMTRAILRDANQSAKLGSLGFH